MTVQFLPAWALLACAPLACSSGNGTPATAAGGHGGMAGAAASAATAGAAASAATAGGAGSSGGMSGATGAGGTPDGTAGGVGGLLGAGGDGGAGGTAVDGGTDAGVAGGRTTEVYDLKSDWSDTQNPSGPWTVMIGTTVAKNLPRWSGEAGQSAYVTAASGNGHIPVLLKVSATNFEGKLAQKGDLVVHAQDEAGGPGLGQARIVWTAPSSGSIDVDASFWLARTSLKRKDVYTVTVAGATKGAGDVPSNMGITRDTPVKFSQKGLPVTKGDTVELQVSHALTCDACSSSPCDGKTGATCAEFCDYLLKITHTSQ